MSLRANYWTVAAEREQRNGSSGTGAAEREEQAEVCRLESPA